MTLKLDQLLQDMNDALNGRLESNLTLEDPYWGKRAAYHKGLAEAGGVHIPDKTTVEESRVKAAQGKPLTPVEASIQKQRKGLAEVGGMGGAPNAPQTGDANRVGMLGVDDQRKEDPKNFEASSAVSEENKPRGQADPQKVVGQVKSAEEQLRELQESEDKKSQQDRDNNSGIQPGVTG